MPICLTAAAIGAAAAAELYVGTPPFNPDPGQQVTIDLHVDVGSDVLGSYFVNFEYDPAVASVVSIAGGTGSGFTDPPVTDPSTFTSGSTPLAAAQGSTTQPSGLVSVARLTLEAVGLPADSSALDLLVDSLYDAEFNPLPSSVFGSSLLVNLPEAALDLTFTNSTTLTWSPTSPLTHYNIYRGSLASAPFAFNHTCFAADLTITQGSDPAAPALNGLSYHLVAGERNSVEGTLGKTSAGLARPQPLSCSTGALAGEAQEADTAAPPSLPVVVVLRGDRAPSARAVWPPHARGGGGDVNGDGRLDRDDSKLVLESVVGVRGLSRAQRRRADADGDGDVDIADAQRIEQRRSGPLPARAKPLSGD